MGRLNFVLGGEAQCSIMAVRVSNTSVDWAKAMRLAYSPEARASMKSLKILNDKYLIDVNKHKPEMPKIDFEKYRNSLADPTIVDLMESEMKKLKVPYPQDKENLVSQINADEKEAKEMSAAYIKQIEADVEILKEAQDLYQKMPGRERMTRQQQMYYFPHTIKHILMPGDNPQYEGEQNMWNEYHYECLIQNAFNINYRLPEEYLRDRTTGIMLMRNWLKQEDLPEWYMDAERGPPTAEEEDALEAKFGQFFDNPHVQESLNTYYPVIWTERELLDKFQELQQAHLKLESGDSQSLPEGKAAQESLPPK